MKRRFIMLLISIFGFTSAIGAETKGLTQKEQEVVRISAFTASGDLENLKISLNDGLDAGLTVNEIKEILVHTYAYCGFPRSLNGIGVFMNVLSEREEKGIKDEVGRDITPIPSDRNSIEFGTEVQTKLAGAPVQGGMYDFAPAVDEFLKGHLFGDLFGRDVIDFKTREIVTIAALGNMTGVNPQLAAHFNLGMNAGLTKEQINGIIDVFDKKIGKNQGKNAREIFDSVLKSR
ncbi:carboxymuconolactone decarboxylase family protein [Fusobacterium sp.]|uniref:carboxymuconolactone decarboxylase family protein n=1 Tax=Fusobacterium sp. TaxID=68766 RepID=UPI0029008374|nr:carboxymuconolactone decarboxylase family protein [Fusobacterium sp.]MDU1910708.1 carboxymuconolactone decarboxylase family protein [Fusobacterium sp.]